MSQPSVVVRAASTSHVASIPFRTTPAASGPDVVGTLVTTLLVLAALTGLAWWANRRGWLDRWTGMRVAGVARERKLRVAEVLRISRRTTVFRLHSGEREFLLVESGTSVSLLAADMAGERTT